MDVCADFEQHIQIDVSAQHTAMGSRLFRHSVVNNILADGITFIKLYNQACVQCCQDRLQIHRNPDQGKMLAGNE